MTMGEHDSQFEHVSFPGRGRVFEDGEEVTSGIFDVNAYVAEKMKAFTSAVDAELETQIIEHLRGKGWLIDKREPTTAGGGEDRWWRIRNAVMGEISDTGFDYETRSRIAEDAAREATDLIGREGFKP